MFCGKFQVRVNSKLTQTLTDGLTAGGISIREQSWNWVRGDQFRYFTPKSKYLNAWGFPLQMRLTKVAHFCTFKCTFEMQAQISFSSLAISPINLSCHRKLVSLLWSCLFVGHRQFDNRRQACQSEENPAICNMKQPDTPPTMPGVILASVMLSAVCVHAKIDTKMAEKVRVVKESWDQIGEASKQSVNAQ